MNRQQLVDTLELLKPALATHDQIPVLQCYCFDAGTVTATNDSVAILGPSAVDCTCGISGLVLLGLLSKSSSEEVTIELENSTAVVKCGKTRGSVPFMESNAFIFMPPDSPYNNTCQLAPNLMEAIDVALATVSTDETQAGLQGITLVRDVMYSCNGDILTRIKVKAPVKDRVLLPTAFCEAMLRLWKNLQITKGQLHYNDKWAYADFGEWSVYGQIREISDPIDFEALVKKTVKSKVSPCLLPEGLRESLTRATIFTAVDSKPTTVSIRKQKMHLHTSTHVGDVDDHLVLNDHPDVEARVSASHLVEAIKSCETIAIHENCTVLEKDNIFILVSNMS